MSAERRACPERARSRVADEWRKFAHTCLRRRGHGWHAPFGAPLPSLMTGSESFLASSWLAKLGRMRASRERFCLSACGLILSPLPHPGEVASEASGTGRVAAVPSQAAAPPHPDLLPAAGRRSANAPRSDFVYPPRAQRGGGGPRDSVVEGACGGSVRSDRRAASPPTPLPPPCLRRAVPLPRFAGQDGRYSCDEN